MTRSPSSEDVPAELVRLARGGDPQAVRSLVARAHPLVRRWALVGAGDPADADDIAQDVLVHMIRRLDRYEGRSAFTTWLYAVTRNAVRDHLRARNRRERLHADPRIVPEDAGSGQPDALLAADRARLAHAALRLFRELPARQREVFDLAELQGLTAMEVGERLGIAASTVRVNLLRARRNLRARLLELAPAGEDRA